MRIIRYLNDQSIPVLAALTNEGFIYPLPQRGFLELIQRSQKQNASLLAFVESLVFSLDPLSQPLEKLSLADSMSMASRSPLPISSRWQAT